MKSLVHNAKSNAVQSSLCSNEFACLEVYEREAYLEQSDDSLCSIMKTNRELNPEKYRYCARKKRFLSHHSVEVHEYELLSVSR
jgi:hypothetical protein